MLCPFLDLCVSSLRRGHANLLCIVPILSDVPEGTFAPFGAGVFKELKELLFSRCGTLLGLSYIPRDATLGFVTSVIFMNL